MHAVTVTISGRALAEQSSSPAGTWAFELTVRVTNGGGAAARIAGRRWTVEDDEGRVQDLHGTGLGGTEPVVAAGVTFVHTWRCVVRTPRATVRGGVVLDDGTFVEAAPLTVSVLH